MITGDKTTKKNIDLKITSANNSDNSLDLSKFSFYTIISFRKRLGFYETFFTFVSSYTR
mgnify:FL=1